MGRKRKAKEIDQHEKNEKKQQKLDTLNERKQKADYCFFGKNDLDTLLGCRLTKGQKMSGLQPIDPMRGMKHVKQFIRQQKEVPNINCNVCGFKLLESSLKRFSFDDLPGKEHLFVDQILFTTFNNLCLLPPVDHGFYVCSDCISSLKSGKEPIYCPFQMSVTFCSGHLNVLFSAICIL